MSQAMVLIFLMPMIGGAVTFLPRPKWQRLLGILTALATCVSVAALAKRVLAEGPQMYWVGGWLAPLGINLRCDGFSLLMLLLTAIIGLVTSIYSLAYFTGAKERAERSGIFWPLWLFLWGGMNCLFVSGDIFNLYLLLEFTLLASVGLASLAGSNAALVSALRYLLAATTAALFYLLGVTFLYSEYSTLDLHGLTAAAPSGFLPLLALGLMMGGLALKSALFPLHFWLPPAHSTAPAPVSAVLSALVVKAGFYVMVRLWFGVFPDAAPQLAGQLLSLLGAVAVLWGSWMALRQKRLKMLVAYSTVAQVGYLFLLFPMVTSTDHEILPATVYQVISHALAKAAMFLGAGALLQSVHSDLLTRTRGAFRGTPVAVLTIMLSGASLAGIAPGGGAKGKLIGIALDAGHWGWALVIGVGMLLAVGYTFIAVKHCFRKPIQPGQPAAWNVRLLEWLALLLASAGIAVSFLSTQILRLMEIQFTV
jgi:multicomponent Na+:H+ antiporter subunit D